MELSGKSIFRDHSFPGKGALDAQTCFVGLDFIEELRVQSRQKNSPSKPKLPMPVFLAENSSLSLPVIL